MVLAYKYFFDPFASAGDTAAVPDTVQSDGSVSWPQGYGPDYAMDPEVDPQAILVGRDQFNEILNAITTALAAIQTDYPGFVSDADNNGSPFAYNQGAVVRFTDGALWTSLVNANTATPGTDATKWVIFLSQYATAAALAAETARAIGVENTKAPINSPAFTGSPTAPTQSPGAGGAAIATCAYVLGAVQSETNRAIGVENTKAPINSPAFTGNPTVPEPVASNSIPTVNYVNVQDAATLATAIAAVAAETARAIGVENTKAPINSPAFGGNPTCPDPVTQTSLANAEYVQAVVAGETARAMAVEATKAPYNSPAFTGVPTTPTPPGNSADGTIPNTAWVRSVLPQPSQGLVIQCARLGVPVGGAFALASFTWNGPFPNACLAAVASCETNDVFNPGSFGNNWTACVISFDVNGGVVRIDNNQGAQVSGNVAVDIIGAGV